MQAEPTMAISVIGLLCLGIMAMLFVTMLVGTVVMLASIKDRRVWDGLFKAGMIGVPILVGVLFVVMLVGFTTLEVHRAETQTATVYHPPQPPSVETMRVSREEEVAERLRAVEQTLQAQEVETTAPVTVATNDLRPVDALSAAPATPSGASSPKATGDLRSTSRPSWLQKGIAKEGDVTTVVLVSPLFATEQEAEESIRSESLTIIEKDLLSIVRNRPIQPRMLGLFPTVLPYYVKDRFVESEQRDLGAVTAPMYRVWQKLELSPRTREQGLMLYRTEASQARLALVGAGLGGLLAIPLGVLVSARGTRWTHGRGRRLWQASSTMLVFGAWFAGLMWLRQFIVFFG